MADGRLTIVHGAQGPIYKSPILRGSALPKFRIPLQLMVEQSGRRGSHDTRRTSFAYGIAVLFNPWPAPLPKRPAIISPNPSPWASPERWDYVIYDKTGNRVFVAHGDRVAVVDAKSGAVLGQSKAFPAARTAPWR